MKNSTDILSYQSIFFIRGGKNVEYPTEALYKEKTLAICLTKKKKTKKTRLYNRALGTLLLHEITCQFKHFSKYMIYTQGYLCWKSVVICRGKNQTCHMNSFQHKSQSRETLEKRVCEGGLIARICLHSFCSSVISSALCFERISSWMTLTPV